MVLLWNVPNWCIRGAYIALCGPFGKKEMQGKGSEHNKTEQSNLCFVENHKQLSAVFHIRRRAES